MKQPVNQNIRERVRVLAHPILASMGFELVEVEQRGGPGRALLRIYIDKAGGVTLNDCEQASVHLGHALDVEDPIPYPYTLEVSSPGLDRPLKKPADYQRAMGRSVRIKLIQPVEEQRVLIGRLMGVEEDRIRVEIKDGKQCEIPLTDIHQARLEIEW